MYTLTHWEWHVYIGRSIRAKMATHPHPSQYPPPGNPPLFRWWGGEWRIMCVWMLATATTKLQQQRATKTGLRGQQFADFRVGRVISNMARSNQGYPWERRSCDCHRILSVLLGVVTRMVVSISEFRSCSQPTPRFLLFRHSVNSLYRAGRRRKDILASVFTETWLVG